MNFARGPNDLHSASARPTHAVLTVRNVLRLIAILVDNENDPVIITCSALIGLAR
jgi:hypothetical protein